MTTQNKVTFKVQHEEKEVELAVIRPTLKTQEQAQLVYAAAFNRFVRGGGILKQQLESHVREQKVWDDAKQKEFESLLSRLTENEQKMPDEAGRVRQKGLTVAEVKKAAIQLRRDRIGLRNLLMERSELESNTVEELAKQSKFNYLVSACTVYSDSGKPFFSSHEDYLSRADDEASSTAASKFAMLYYRYDPQEEHKLPENVFLKKYKLCDEQLHLVDGAGRLIDTEGRLVNDEGRFINEAGDYVDSEGRPVDKNGDLLTETFPLVDDDGNTVEPPAVEKN